MLHFHWETTNTLVWFVIPGVIKSHSTVMKFKIIMQTAYFAFNDNLKDFRDSDWLIAVQTFSVENIPEKKVMRLNYAEHLP